MLGCELCGIEIRVVQPVQFAILTVHSTLSRAEHIILNGSKVGIGGMNRRGLLGFIFLGVFVALVSCKREATVSRSSLPFGSVDLPGPKSTVRGPMQVAGWALADQPIREIAVYIDGQYLTSTSPKMPRPDVVLAKPDYRDARNCGFTLTVDTLTLAVGWHEILVQARAQDGATRDLAAVPVLVQR